MCVANHAHSYGTLLHSLESKLDLKDAALQESRGKFRIETIKKKRKGDVRSNGIVTIDKTP